METGTSYEGRMRLATYDVASNSMLWYREQYEVFGHAAAVAYGDWGSATDSPNIYIGGAADDSRYQDSS